MDYRELAAKQHGFLLHNQLTEEEYNEAVETGFIITPPLDDEQALMEYVHYTELTMLPEYGDIADKYYQEWLIAFPTIPPEERQPTPYFAGKKALKMHRFLTGWSTAPSLVITPPELMPYINEEYGYTYVMDENITPDDWVLVDDIPLENIIPAMRKYYEYADMDDYEWCVNMVSSARQRGYSQDEIAWAVEPAAGVWYNYKTGKRPTNGKELLELFSEQ
ncbi:hypothetical protein [Corynebacterium matruchotii]|uniref:hypothetical protein n=1 Tax=Corynebacterium matruchotii TaxID=43768 RepID=UPI0028F07795|nr:hypothetical protein [Corynebacterium matruchotii]